MKKDIVSKELIENWKAARQQADALENKITDRMNYVIHRCCEIFGHKISGWWFDGAAEGEVGNLMENLNDYFVPLLYPSRSDDMLIILKDGTELNILDEGFLTRWLFEDFETEVKEGKQKYKEKDIKRKTELKRLSEQQKAERLALIQSAKSKLSKKELAALKKVL